MRIHISKESVIELFQETGFEVLGEAHIPQRKFQLPKNIKDAVDGNRNGRNSCIITIVLSD
jgi:hypothetical protein